MGLSTGLNKYIRKDHHDPDNHDGEITHQELDIVDCEVKWALGSISMKKASGGDGIPPELFKILRDDAVKVLQSICQQIWKPQQWIRVEKNQILSKPKERQCQRMFKLQYNCAHFTY